MNNKMTLVVYSPLVCWLCALAKGARGMFRITFSSHTEYKIFITAGLLLFDGCFASAQSVMHSADTVAPGGYSRGIIYIAPVQFTENGPGLGLAYNRMANAKKNLELTLTGMATFNVANTNRIYNYNTGYYNTGNPDAMYYLLAGIACYPFGSTSKFTYSLGPSIDIGSGRKSTGYYDYNGLNLAERIQKHFIAGALLQNYIHYNYTRRTSLEMEMGVGGSFINKVGGNNQDNQFLIQGAFKIGYRI